MKLIRVGVDLAKNVFQLHGVDRSERVVWRRRLRRENWIAVLCEQLEPGAEVGMEACGGAHHWARLLQRLGYKVKLIAPQFVKPSSTALARLAPLPGQLRSVFGMPRTEGPVGVSSNRPLRATHS